MQDLEYPKLNVMGRMCNQYFALASSYGIAKKANRKLVIQNGNMPHILTCQG